MSTQGLKTFFKNHYFGLLTSLTVGFIIFLPQLLFITNESNNYQGIYMGETDNDFFYNARIRDAYEGNFRLNEVTMEGTISEPYTNPPLGENIVAFLGNLSTLEFHQIIMISGFFFNFFLALVFYFLGWRLSGSKVVAVLVPLGVILCSNFLFYPRNLVDLLVNQGNLLTNVYLRPIHPQVSSLIFYTWLSLVLVFQQTQKKHTALLAGLLFGAMFYIYPFSWTLALVIAGLSITYSLWQKNRQVFKGLIQMTLLGFFLAIPFFVNYYHLSQHSLYGVMNKRFVILSSHQPIWSSLLALDLLIVLFYWRKKNKQTYIFLLTLVLSCWVVLNQQIITGIKLFPGHWHWYYVVPISIFLAIVTFYEFFKVKPKIMTAAISALIVIFLFNGLASQLNYYKTNREKYAERQRFASVFKWLENNVAEKSVVLSNDHWFSNLLPVYTRHYHYDFYPTDELYLIPTERLKHTYFVRLFLQGVKPENVNEYIDQDTGELREILLGYYRRYAEDCQRCYSHEELSGLRQEYIDFYQADFEQNLKKYKIDFVVQDTARNAIIDLNKADFAKYIMEINGFRIYKIN